MAEQTLQRALQHGRDHVRGARLIVLTDARGNIPLEASQLGRVEGPVGRRGIEDALRIAARIGDMARVEKFVLYSSLPLPGRLPAELAEAMHAEEQLGPALPHGEDA